MILEGTVSNKLNCSLLIENINHGNNISFQISVNHITTLGRVLPNVLALGYKLDLSSLW